MRQHPESNLRRLRRLPLAALIVGVVAVGALISDYPHLAPPPKPAFDVEPGFHTGPVTVALPPAAPGEELYLRTGGAAPQRIEADRYRQPLTIDTSTVLRATRLRPWIGHSRPATLSLIFAEQVARQGTRPPGLPESWRGRHLQVAEGTTIPADYAMDPRVVPEGSDFTALLAEALHALPTVALVADPDDLFDTDRGIYANATERGMAWERPVSMEYFDRDGTLRFQADAGLRINGLTARRLDRNPKQGLRIHFRGKYGERKLKASLLERHRRTGHDALVLRNMTQDSWATRGQAGLRPAHYIRDSFARQTQAAMGHPAIRAEFVHVYLNALYWGIYSLSERVDGPFMRQRFGGDELDYDIIKGNVCELGTSEAWEEIDAYSKNINAVGAYDAIADRVDLDNFIDYVLIHQFTDNIDWFAANALAARKRAPGGRFFFLAYDAEVTFGSQTTGLDALDFAQLARRAAFFSPLTLFTRLQEHPEFRLHFADRIHRHFQPGGMLSPEKARDRWLELARTIETAIVAESARWGDCNIDGIPRTREQHWRPAINDIADNYFAARVDTLMAHYETEGLLPPLAPPQITRDGAKALVIAPTDGDVFYTTDGTDPRLPGGDLNTPAARLAEDPIPVEGVKILRARAHRDGAWSALAEWTAPATTN